MLLSCGDALIDFLPVRSVDGRDAYVPVAGGSCLNVAIAMARLGAPTGFVGGVSTDLFGEMVAAHASGSAVDLRYALRSLHETTLAFVRFVDGEPHYAFYDEATAARHWAYRRGSIPFGEIDAIHTGSTTLIDAEMAARTLAMLEDARGVTTISFDPNCRPALVADKAAYTLRMDDFAARANILRMSEVDFEFLYGGSDFEPKAKALLASGVSLVIVTQGGRGVLAWHRSAGSIEVEAPHIEVVDTIGAGDSFQGAFLFALREIGRIGVEALASLSRDELHRALTFAMACAAITCGRVGADPPRLTDLTIGLVELLRGRGELPALPGGP
jgi:fructokinase